MHSLRELQADFMRALLDGDPEHAAAAVAAAAATLIAPSPVAVAPRIAATDALGIYANNVRSNFTESLIGSFPAIRRLVGEDYFAQVARGFHARHPSLSGDLQPAGSGFAQYLGQLHGADEYRYLGEVARLEWLIQETLLAADHAALDLTKLGTLAPAEYDDLRFDLHPSARLFASEFPCLEIWQANVGSDAEPEVIDLRAGADRVLMIRSHGELMFHRLTRGEQDFLLALRLGERFTDAVDSGAAGGALDGPPGFDAAAALQRFVLAGVIVDFKSPQEGSVHVVTR